MLVARIDFFGVWFLPSDLSGRLRERILGARFWDCFLKSYPKSIYLVPIELTINTRQYKSV